MVQATRVHKTEKIADATTGQLWDKITAKLFQRQTPRRHYTFL